MLFRSPHVFLALAEGFPLELGIGAWGSRNYNDGAIGPRNKFDDIFSRLDTMHQRDGRTVRHRTTAKTAFTHSVAR